MPNDHGWRVDWYSCTRRNKDGDINSLLEKHKESTGWRIVSPLPKKRPPSWDSVDAGLWLRGQQRTPFFQGHTGAFVVTLGPFHAQCTPQDTAQRRSGIQVQKSYHMSLCFFILLPSSMIEAETFQSSLSKAYVSAKAKDGLLSNPL